MTKTRRLTRLVLIPELSSDPAPFMVVDTHGTVLQRGVLTLDAVEAPPSFPTVAIVPGVDVSIAWLDLPAGSTAQVRAAAFWALRDRLAAPADRLSMTLGAPGRAGEPRMTVVVSQALLSAWSDYLSVLGIRADVMTPDVLTVPEPESDGDLNAIVFGSSVALRGRSFAATVQKDLVDVVAGARRITTIEASSEIERLMIQAALSPAVNLNGGGRDRPAAGGGWRRVAALAAAVILSPLILVVAAATRDTLVADRLERGTLALIAERWPEAAAASEPVEDVRRRLDVALLQAGTAAVASALYAAVEQVEGSELDSLIVDPDEGVRATVTYQAYEDLDRLKQVTARAGMIMTDDSTIDDQGRIVSDIRIGAGA